MPESTSPDRLAMRLEILKLKLERARYRSEIVKWVVVAIGAAVSFAIIDYGKLRLEQLRLTSDNQFRFIEAYAKATEAPQPEIWKRKLDVFKVFATDDHVQEWITNQLETIETFAALDALYRETLKTASELIIPTAENNEERNQARKRFEQLYWADLPFAGESQEVIAAMIAFRDGLMEAEAAPKDQIKWSELNRLMYELSPWSGPHESLRALPRSNEAHENYWCSPLTVWPHVTASQAKPNSGWCDSISLFEQARHFLDENSFLFRQVDEHSRSLKAQKGSRDVACAVALVEIIDDQRAVL
jgi:hypothetical protein